MRLVRWINVAIVILAACRPCCGQSAPAEDVYLIVTRPMFAEAVGPLVVHRRKDGYRVVVSTAPVEAAIRSCGREPAMILLVGDEQGDASRDQPWYVPTQRVAFYRWRSVQSEEMPTDALYGDLDGDRTQDVPVGRLPARTADQAAEMIAKTIAYEARPPRLDDLTFPVWAGTSQWGRAADVLAESMLTGGIEQIAPRWVQPWIIFASSSSPFCRWPPSQGPAFERQLRRGGAFALLIGHGLRRRFHSMEFGIWSVDYDAAEVAPALAEGAPAGPMAIIACYCGDFTGADDCLAEALVKAPAGPVAVIAATTESHPLPNYFSAQAIARAWGGGPRRLGELWLAAQQAAYRAQNPLVEALLAQVEGTLAAQIDTGRIRRDHMLLYAMLGDPATRLKLPRPLHGRLRRMEDGWHWQVERPEGADVLYVGFRPVGQTLPLVSRPITRPAAERTHQAANAVYAFRALAKLTGDQPWEGDMDTPGTLRLVAIGQHAIYAAGLQLTEPTTSPAAK